MANQTFRTTVCPSKVEPFLSTESFPFGIGSCFAATMGARLSDTGFDCCVNPFGVVYNPISIANILDRCRSHKPFTDSDLVTDGEQWFSFEAHGMFNHALPDRCRDDLNAALNTASNALKQSDVLILTFGTSYVYRLNETGEVVANCHKQPSKNFSRQLLEYDAAFDQLSPLLESLLGERPGLHIIVTVSPVRHLRDDPHENQISKSHLLILSDKLCALNSRIHYFPAYEIMMDDLRDYRFYSDDMVHPSPTAIDYIWDTFMGWCFDQRAVELADRVQEILRRKSHRSRNPDSIEHRVFLETTQAMVDQLKQAFPESKFNRNLDLED